jgi:hypothetical protein
MRIRLLVTVLVVMCALNGTSIAASIAKQCRQGCAARSDLDCGSLKKHKKQKCKAKLLHQCVKAKSTEVCQVSTVTPTTIPGGGPTTTSLPPSGACRTYATALTLTTSDGLTAADTCAFDTSMHTLTCNDTQTYESLPGCVRTVDTAFHYDSTADFVDEVSVIPLRTLVTGHDNSPATSTSACPEGYSTAANSDTYLYDSQRRLTQVLFSTSGSTLNYTAWDASGRITMGTGNSADGSVSQSYSYSYDDAARTMTKVVTVPRIGSAGYEAVVTYDANGSIMKQLTTLSDGTVTTGTWVTSGTKTVCK